MMLNNVNFLNILQLHFLIYIIILKQKM